MAKFKRKPFIPVQSTGFGIIDKSPDKSYGESVSQSVRSPLFRFGPWEAICLPAQDRCVVRHVSPRQLLLCALLCLGERAIFQHSTRAECISCKTSLIISSSSNINYATDTSSGAMPCSPCCITARGSEHAGGWVVRWAEPETGGHCSNFRNG